MITSTDLTLTPSWFPLVWLWIGHEAPFHVFRKVTKNEKERLDEPECITGQNTCKSFANLEKISRVLPAVGINLRTDMFAIQRGRDSFRVMAVDDLK